MHKRVNTDIEQETITAVEVKTLLQKASAQRNTATPPIPRLVIFFLNISLENSYPDIS